MKINDIPKFVINLDRRKDRLDAFNKEMRYIGWDYIRFPAIDTNSYVGCARSHQKLSKIILDENYDYAIVMEDDIHFMPYAKELLNHIDNQLFNTDLMWDVLHFAPSIHRPLNQYNEYLLDLKNLPFKDPNKHRGIFGTSAFILTKKACSYIVEWDSDKYIENSHQQLAIDEYFDKILYPNTNSFCPILPLVVQQPSFSDINKTYDSNHYLMTYNWNVYCPVKLDQKMFDYSYCQSLKKYEN